MTHAKLDDPGAQPVVSNSLRPLEAEHPVLSANHGSRTNRGEFGQRARYGVWITRLRSKTIDGGLYSWFVAVGVQQ